MLVIHHRRNTIKMLIETDFKFGVEVDIRSFKNNLVVHHEPFINGILFEEWLRNYNHKFLILNVKEEGLENKILNLMLKFNIQNFFFLDQSFPFLIKTAKEGETRSAVRVSEFESIDTAMKLEGMVDWVWVDFFSRLPLDFISFTKLKEAGFKICLVSPELQGYQISKIYILQKLIKDLNLSFDAVCTKEPNLWISI